MCAALLSPTGDCAQVLGPSQQGSHGLPAESSDFNLGSPHQMLVVWFHSSFDLEETKPINEANTVSF